MGVWIETAYISPAVPAPLVTPCMGVWIETCSDTTLLRMIISHTLYGCVD